MKGRWMLDQGQQPGHTNAQRRQCITGDEAAADEADAAHVGGHAFARRTCEGCRLELNAVDVARLTASDPDEVARCEECGRILVRS